MLYEFTVTLKPALYKEKAIDQFRMTRDLMYQMLAPHQSTCIAELTKAYNIHYHCLVELADLSQRVALVDRLRKIKLFGRFTLSQVQWEQSYKDYIVKHITETTAVIIKDPVVCDYFGLVNCPKNWDLLLKHKDDFEMYEEACMK